MSCMTLVHTVNLRQFCVKKTLVAVGRERVTPLVLILTVIFSILSSVGWANASQPSGKVWNSSESESQNVNIGGWFDSVCSRDSNDVLFNVSGFTWNVRDREPFLDFCSSHSFNETLTGDCRALFQPNVSMNHSHCACLYSIVQREREAKTWVESFTELLGRVDCRQAFNPYAVQWTCTHCKDSYKEWACGTNIENYDVITGVLRPLCGSVCEQVISRCTVVDPFDSYSAIPLFDCPDDLEEKTCFKPSDKYPAMATAFSRNTTVM